MESREIQSDVCDTELKEHKFEDALVRLKSMKDRVVDLRVQCESLRKLQEEKPAEKVVCSDCGKEIEQGQEVMVKDSSGNPMSWYHRDCFRAIWVSEDWKVHYSSHGFLKMSKEGQ